jgi:hypothetical protein
VRWRLCPTEPVALIIPGVRPKQGHSPNSITVFPEGTALPHIERYSRAADFRLPFAF